MTDLNGKTIGILGLGQVGGSLAWALKTNCPEARIIAFDVKPKLMTEAADRSILDQTAESAANLVEMADIVIMALTIDNIVEMISTMAPAFHEKLLVTDVGSVMKDIVAEADEAGLKNYVSGHPLAGTEKRGSAAWKETLFVGSNYFMTPRAETTNEARQTMRALIKAVGAEPVEVRAVAHDLAFASTSNLSHVLAFCLRRAFDRLSDQVADKNRFACPSYLGATRVAASDPDMVFQMLWHNRDYLAGALRSLTSELEIVRHALMDNQPHVFCQALGLKTIE